MSRTQTSELPPLVAVAGGIGSGKSVVCRILTCVGLNVYDCDSRAKALMDNDPEIHRRLREEIAREVVDHGVILRPLLSRIVFSNPDKLLTLNNIVHGRVKEDLLRWRELHVGEPMLFVETAILLESNLKEMITRVWHVTADNSVRIERACRRDGVTPEEIMRRMKSQRPITPEALNCPVDEIDNNGTTPLLPRIFQLLETFGVNPTFGRQWKN